MGEVLECNSCNLRIYEGKRYQLQPEVLGSQNIKCSLGLHDYEYVVHLYENVEPLSVAIFRICSRCGKGQDAPIAYKAVESVTKRVK